MSIKKIVAIFLIAVLCVLCCACGDSPDTGSEAPSSAPVGSDTADTSSETESKPAADATLTIKVKKGEIEKFKSDRPHDKNKEDISLMLIVGQSNFTTSVGFSSEYGGVLNGKIQNFSEVPVVPEKGTCYSSGGRKAITSLSADRDMSKLCNEANLTNTLGGVTPSFGI